MSPELLVVTVVFEGTWKSASSMPMIDFLADELTLRGHLEGEDLVKSVEELEEVLLDFRDVGLGLADLDDLFDDPAHEDVEIVGGLVLLEDHLSRLEGDEVATRGQLSPSGRVDFVEEGIVLEDVVDLLDDDRSVALLSLLPCTVGRSRCPGQ